MLIVAADRFGYGQLVYSVALDGYLAVRGLIALCAAEPGVIVRRARMSRPCLVFSCCRGLCPTSSWDSCT